MFFDFKKNIGSLKTIHFKKIIQISKRIYIFINYKNNILLYKCYSKIKNENTF